MDFFSPDRPGFREKQWISVPSELLGIHGERKEIRIGLIEDGKPQAVAFFDIDGTLAHLSQIHGKAITRLFPDQDPAELEETYYRGFKLGNSFREFDRMKGIYIDGHTEWKDPEIYLKERFIPHAQEIDEPGHAAHETAAAILKEYGKTAADICEEVFQQNPEVFKNANIEPIFKLARMYSRLGIPMVGFTANAKIFVEKLAKYLGLSDMFIDIATDEDMAGGGKEIAIHHLIEKIESKGVKVPKDRLLFVGDSLRGDIGTSLKARSRDSGIRGQGILVMENRDALIELERQISESPELRTLADSIDINALVIGDVPTDEKGNPILLSRFRDQFMRKL